MQPESRLATASLKALRQRGAVAIKIHGDEFSRVGEPDLVGVYKSVPFAIELKVPGEEPTKIQVVRLWEWHEAGAYVGLATTVEEVLDVAVNHLPIGWDLMRKVMRGKNGK